MLTALGILLGCRSDEQRRVRNACSLQSARIFVSQEVSTSPFQKNRRPPVIKGTSRRIKTTLYLACSAAMSMFWADQMVDGQSGILSWRESRGLCHCENMWLQKENILDSGKSRRGAPDEGTRTHKKSGESLLHARDGILRGRDGPRKQAGLTCSKGGIATVMRGPARAMRALNRM
jgi:hypothetical protein